MKRIVATVIFAFAFLLPSAALAETRTGSQADPAGDSAVPAYDITKLEASYDTNGTLSASVTLAAAPDEANPAAVIIMFGTLAGNTCSIPDRFNGAALMVDAPGGTPIMGGDGKRNDPTLSIEGSTVTMKGTDSKLANKRWNCARALAGNRDAADPADTLDPVALAAAKPSKSQQRKLRSALKRCSRKRSKSARSRCARRAKAKYRR